MLSAQPSRVILLDTGEGGSLGELGRPDPGCSPGRGRAREGRGGKHSKDGVRAPVCRAPARARGRRQRRGQSSHHRTPCAQVPAAPLPSRAALGHVAAHLRSSASRPGTGHGHSSCPLESESERGPFRPINQGEPSGRRPASWNFLVSLARDRPDVCKDGAGRREGEHGGGSACTGERHFGWRDPKGN